MIECPRCQGSGALPPGLTWNTLVPWVCRRCGGQGVIEEPTDATQ